MTKPKIFFGNSFCIQEFILSIDYTKKLEKFINRFKDYFKKYEERCLSLINKYTGFGFKEDEIMVWFFDNNLDSIPDPVLICARGYDNEVVFFELVRMLTLRNLLFNGIYSYYKNEYAMNKVEVYSYLVGKKIIKEIFSEKTLKKIYKTLVNDFNVYLWEDCKKLEKKIDLDEITVKESLEKGIKL